MAYNCMVWSDVQILEAANAEGEVEPSTPLEDIPAS